MIATAILLVLLGATFMRGFREVVGLAAVIVGVFLVLNTIVVVNGLIYVGEHPDLVSQWLDNVQSGNWYLSEEDRILPGKDWLTIIAMSLLIFPKLALGLSGFETGVAVMPLIKGDPDDDPHEPKGRIRNARKLLITAAVIMSFFLITSSFVVSTLIPPDAFTRQKTDDPAKKYAKDRALAYLAHGDGPHQIMLSGEAFGTMYDVSTVVILWFAGASAMAGLLNLVPQYLPRYGMAPEWARAIRPLVLLLTGINLLVTWIFRASVTDQGGAYATGVLVLITSAGVATVIERWRENKDAGTYLHDSGRRHRETRRHQNRHLLHRHDPDHIVLLENCAQPRAAFPRLPRARYDVKALLGYDQAPGAVGPGAAPAGPALPGEQGIGHSPRASHPARHHDHFRRSGADRRQRVRPGALAGGARGRGAIRDEDLPGRLDCAHPGGRGPGNGESGPAARNPLWLDRGFSFLGAAGFSALRRGQRPLDGARTDPQGGARPGETAVHRGGRGVIAWEPGGSQ
jgi:hypothetical protein